jgi:hypothetical protein
MARRMRRRMREVVVFKPDGSEWFRFSLLDEKAALWQQIADARGQTLSESLEQILTEFMDAHPILRTRNTEQ